MGVVADEALRLGGTVVGVIPALLTFAPADGGERDPGTFPSMRGRGGVGRVLAREPTGRAPTIGRPWLWKLKSFENGR
jgi:hypothetical protein